MPSRYEVIHAAALEYVELMATLASVQEDVALVRKMLLSKMMKGEGIELTDATVLVIMDHAPDRKNITQKMLHEAGVPQTCFDRLMKATKPPIGKRVRTLKTVLASDFEASHKRRLLSKQSVTAAAPSSAENSDDDAGSSSD